LGTGKTYRHCRNESIAKGKDGRIYVATNGDIGYLAPGKKENWNSFPER
jgi:hypothetical protein